MKEEKWNLIIRPQARWFDLNLKEAWRYRDLLVLLVKRDFIAQYKQTILGPLWHFITPVFTTLTFTVIFGNIAKLPTDGLPAIVFYMSGVTIWNYFAQILTSTSNTFVTNAGIFGKVYFPRIVSPLATVFSKTIQFAIQLLLLLSFVVYYKMTGFLPGMDWINLLLIPLVVVIIAGMGLGLGIMLSSLTTKYRDLSVLIGFGVNLLMYMTPVIFPLSSVSAKFRAVLELNPLTAVIEFFRYITVGVGSFNSGSLIYSFVWMMVLCFLGLMLFNRVEKNVMDTV